MGKMECVSSNTAITICGTFFGMQWEVLIIAVFISTFLSVAMGTIDNRKKAIGGILLAAVGAGLGAIPLAAFAITENPWLLNYTSFENIRNLAAGLIAAFGPTIIPLLVILSEKIVRRKSEVL